MLSVDRADHALVDGALADQTVAKDRTLLPLPVQSCVGLLVLLEVPGRRVPDDDVAALLHVETVLDRGGLAQQEADLAAVPLLQDLGFAGEGDGVQRLEAFLQPLELVPVLVEHQDRIVARGLDDVLECAELGVVDLVPSVLGVVHGPAGELEELVGEIWDESDEVKSPVTLVTENVFDIYGDVSLNSLRRYFDSHDIDIEIVSEAHTVAGWVLEIFGSIPKNGDSHETDEYTVTILEAANLRVSKVRFEIKKNNEE